MEQAPQREKAKNIDNLKNIFPFLKGAVAALLLFIALRFFLFDIVKVNAKDMQDTYCYDDAVLIKKAFNSYSFNDVIYFEFPLPDSSNDKTYCIQRIAGFSGDTIELKNKILYVNNKRIEDENTFKHNYFVKAKQRFDTAFKFNHHLIEGGEISDDSDYSYALTSAERDWMVKDSLVKSITLKSEDRNNYDENCFPSYPLYPWNMDQYGKLYIPKKNDTLRLDTINIHLYKTIIGNYEKNKLDVLNSKIFINDSLSTQYIVKQNYFFMLGDNRDNANDSRIWGFLPEKFIIGKVVGIIKRSAK